MMNAPFDISWASLWRIFIFVTVAAAAFFARQALLAIFLAIILSAGIDSLVSFLERKRVPRLLGTLIIFIVALGILGGVLYAVLPIALIELNGFFSGLQHASGEVVGVGTGNEFAKAVSDQLLQLSNLFIFGKLPLLEFGTQLVGGAALMLSVFVISFYLAVSRDGIERFLRALLPLQYEEYALSVVARARRKIGFWLQAQILLSASVGLLVFVGLWTLGVKYSLVLGILAGIFEIVPFVGPIFTGAIAVLFAFSDSVILALYALILFVIIQQFEAHLVIPLVVRRAVGIHPVIVLIALLLGAKLAGFVGLIIAVPTAVILQEFLEDWVSVKDTRRASRLVG